MQKSSKTRLRGQEDRLIRFAREKQIRGIRVCCRGPRQAFNYLNGTVDDHSRTNRISSLGLFKIVKGKEINIRGANLRLIPNETKRGRIRWLIGSSLRWRTWRLREWPQRNSCAA